MLVVNRQANDVGWQQVGSELNSLKAAMKRAGERVGERCFADSRNVFNQQVPAGNQGDDPQPDGLRFAFDNGFDRLLQDARFSPSRRR